MKLIYFEWPIFCNLRMGRWIFWNSHFQNFMETWWVDLQERPIRFVSLMYIVLFWKVDSKTQSVNVFIIFCLLDEISFLISYNFWLIYMLNTNKGKGLIMPPNNWLLHLLSKVLCAHVCFCSLIWNTSSSSFKNIYARRIFD